MSVTSDITATYRGPRRVMRRLLSMGRREDRALIFGLFAGVMVFVAQSPWHARLAHFDPSVPLEARLYWSGLFSIFIVPLFLYVIATLLYFICRAFGGQMCSYDVRLALFWSLLSSSPVLLLLGMVAGFIGPGAEVNGVAVVWCVVFMWFLVSCVKEAAWPSS